jgi:hypothetical protein
MLYRTGLYDTVYVDRFLRDLYTAAYVTFKPVWSCSSDHIVYTCTITKYHEDLLTKSGRRSRAMRDA